MSFYSIDAWNKTNKTESKGKGRMDSIPEETDAQGCLEDEDEDEEDLGHF